MSDVNQQKSTPPSVDEVNSQDGEGHVVVHDSEPLDQVVDEEKITDERGVTVAGDGTHTAAVKDGVAEFLARRTPGTPYTAVEIEPMLVGAADQSSAERIAEVLNIFQGMVPPPLDDD